MQRVMQHHFTWSRRNHRFIRTHQRVLHSVYMYVNIRLKNSITFIRNDSTLDCFFCRRLLWILYDVVHTFTKLVKCIRRYDLIMHSGFAIGDRHHYDKVARLNDPHLSFECAVWQPLFITLRWPHQFSFTRRPKTNRSGPNECTWNILFTR